MQTTSPILSSVPDKLKSDCINQLDHLLFVVNSSELTAVDLLPKIADEHLATSLVLNKLAQIDDVSMAWLSLRDLVDGDLSKSPLLCLTHNGDSFFEIEKTLSNGFKQRFKKLIRQDRLRLTSTQGAGNFCVMSSAGAFIQLESKHGLVDVLALSHELGDALGFEQRWHQGQYLPPEVVSSEAEAIAMEFYVLNQASTPCVLSVCTQTRSTSVLWPMAPSTTPI